MAKMCKYFAYMYDIGLHDNGWTVKYCYFVQEYIHNYLHCNFFKPFFDQIIEPLYQHESRACQLALFNHKQLCERITL